MWVIYSYLVSKRLLIIEDQYFGWNSERTKKYLDRTGYYNPLEKQIYKPILDRMVSSGHLDIINLQVSSGRFFDHYVIGKRFIREKKLNILI